MEVYTWRVREGEKDARLQSYVEKALPLLPGRYVRQAFEKRDVKVDGVRARAQDAVIPGSVISVYTPYAPEIPIAYEDDRVLVIVKPAGLCVEDENAGMTVLSLMEKRAKGEYRPRLCHRLDTQTCGLLVLCKDDESEEALKKAFRERTLKKEYECLVRGEMRPPKAVCSAFLVKNAALAKVRIVSHETPGSKPITTGYEVIGREGELSRLRVDLITGRTHQIRAHMAYLAHPLLGDDLYGDRTLNRRLKANGLKLCAVRLEILSLDAPLDYLNGRVFEIAAPF
ncbi:MAG: RluA family pseudouridine synthase [Clostridiales bacterium]|nr:RluA family pseudouridine synthase [Clostridiales bacterium]